MLVASGPMSDLATRLAQSTLALCRIPSPIGEERALADHVERWAHAHFPPREVFRLGHSLVLGSLQDSRPTVALVGHLDTVPAHPSDREPRASRASASSAWAASDMKGGLAVMMALAEDLPRAELPVNLVLVLYEREEGPYLESGLGPLFEHAAGAEAGEVRHRDGADGRGGAGGVRGEPARDAAVQGAQRALGAAVAGGERHPQGGAAAGASCWRCRGAR